MTIIFDNGLQLGCNKLQINKFNWHVLFGDGQVTTRRRVVTEHRESFCLSNWLPTRNEIAKNPPNWRSRSGSAQFRVQQGLAGCRSLYIVWETYGLDNLKQVVTELANFVTRRALKCRLGMRTLRRDCNTEWRLSGVCHEPTAIYSTSLTTSPLVA